MFDETVSLSTFRATAITFQSVNTSASTQYTLTGSVVPAAANWIYVAFSLSAADVPQIKQRLGFVKSRATTWISFTSLLIQDTSSPANSIVAVSATGAHQAGLYVADTTVPILQSYTLDMQTGLVALTFDEAMDVTSLYYPGFTFQSTQAGTDLSYILTGGSLFSSSTDLKTVTFTLSPADRRGIKLIDNVAKDSSSTFLAVNSSAITDVASNPVRAVSTAAAMAVSSYNFDGLAPSLVSFNLNMNYNETTALLSLTFNDVVIISSLDTTKLTLRALASTTDPNLFYTLTGGASHSADGYVVDIELSFADTNNIKAKSGLATSVNNTYITLNSTNAAPMIRDDPACGRLALPTAAACA